jgi:hypothetical protein
MRCRRVGLKTVGEMGHVARGREPSLSVWTGQRWLTIDVQDEPSDMTVLPPALDAAHASGPIDTYCTDTYAPHLTPLTASFSPGLTPRLPRNAIDPIGHIAHDTHHVLEANLGLWCVGGYGAARVELDEIRLVLVLARLVFGREDARDCQVQRARVSRDGEVEEVSNTDCCVRVSAVGERRTRTVQAESSEVEAQVRT